MTQKSEGDYKFVTKEEVLQSMREVAPPSYWHGIIKRLLAEREAYREVAIMNHLGFDRSNSKRQIDFQARRILGRKEK